MTFPFYDYDSDFFSTEDLLFLAGASGGKAVEDTATGNPVTFETDLAKPLKSLVANFLPIQASGTPSPENDLPITGWTGVDVFHSGINVFDGELEAGYLDQNTGTKVGSTNIRTKNYISVVPNTKYRVVFEKTGQSAYNMCIFFYRKDKTLVSKSWVMAGQEITVSADAYFAMFFMDSAYTSASSRDIAINYPSTETEFVPYNGTVYPVTFPSTIYGGYVDLVTGEVWQTWKGIDLGTQNYTKRSENTSRQVWEAFISDAKFYNYGTSAYRVNAKCSEFDLTTSNGSWTVGKFAPALEGQNKVLVFVFQPNSFADGTECKEAMQGIQLVYELTTPVLITTLTPQQINAIKNQTNTIWSDANGDCEVTFLKKG